MYIKFYTFGEIPEGKMKYSVIAARYNGLWVFSRHRERATWEIPGGHIEVGETALEAARRELFEETGALDFELFPVCAYKIEDCGTLFFAEIKNLGPVPKDSEIAEVCFLDRLPKDLTYPHIQPHLLRAVNGWLCNQTSRGELWDIYDKDRRLTGRTHKRGELLGAGEYHLVVHIWLKNSKGEFLITKRAPTKGFPNMWECTGGSALLGDDSLTAALREVREETGLCLSPENGRIVHTHRGHDYFCDVWLFREDHKLSEVTLCEGETTDRMLADGNTIRNMLTAGEFIDYSYINEILDIE